MWRYCLLVLVTLSSGSCQYLAQQVAPAGGHDGSGWDIRLAVPGEPGRDYPTLDVIPKTGFSCAGKDAGYYADVETRCQVFRVCTIGATYGFQSFLCPNGTLFNQEVFVCDWWMNVNCQGSQKYFNNNNDKFGNLRLGPSLMSDIKKMLIYPMNNPYNKNNLNNNQLVMQVYNPPSGQPFSNRGLGGNVGSNFINQGFRPLQQLQLPVVQNSNHRLYNENQFSGSTPSPQYVAANVDEANFINNARLAQLQNGQYQNEQQNQYLNSQSNGVGVSNGNNAQFGQLRNENGNTYSHTYAGQNLNTQNDQYNGYNSQLAVGLNSQAQYNNIASAQFQDGLANSQKYQFSNTQNVVNQNQASQYNNDAFQTGKHIQYANNFNGQYNQDAKTTSNTGGRQNELEVTFTKQQYTYPSQYDKQYTYKISADLANNLQVEQLQEVKHNLVSELNFNKNPITTSPTNPVHSPPTVVTKSVNVTHGIKSGKLLSSNIPNSRITYKTWVVQPSKSNQLVSKHTPYKYERPKSARQYVATPTVPPQLYLPSTSRSTISPKLVLPTRSTISSRLYLAPPRPSLSAKLNLPIAPTTLKPSRLYLNSFTSKPTAPARVYSSPNPSIAAKLTASQEPIYNRNNQFHASSSTLAPVYSDPLKTDVSNQSFTITKHSHINTNHNNLTFTDILTKEKLDFTVNDIVKDTSDILETTESKLGQLREGPKNNADSMYPLPLYLPSQAPSIENRNITTTQNLIPSTKPTSQSARLTQNPSTLLQLPVETLRNNQTNQITNLQYYKPKEFYSQTNLEKLVSFKITVPQRTAKFILQSKNESEFDKLEILTAGKSNYLVLVNNGRTSSKPRRNFIPLGKLIGDENSNISNPQAFVYDFLANSIDAAKTYENTLNENAQKLHFATANVFGQQFQSIDAEDLSDISQKISQLTSAQYKNNNNNIFQSNQHQTGNLLSTSQTTTDTGNTYRGSAKFTNNQQIQNGAHNHIRSGQLRQSPEINGNFYSTNFYNGNAGTSSKFQVNPNDVQNGQYYQSNLVNQNINQQIPTNSVYTNNAIQKNAELKEFEHNSNVGDSNINNSREGAEVELVNADLQNADRSAAKLQVAPTAGNSQEAEISNTASQSSTRGLNENTIGANENGIGAQFHNQVVGSINHPKSDKNLITYKADKSFYVYTKYVGNGGSKSSSNTENKRFGELRQAERSDEFSKVEQNNDNGHEVLTTVQFIPSLSFELDDENDRRSLVKVLQNQGGSSAAYTSSENSNGYSSNVARAPTSSADYSVQRTTSNNQGVLQQFKQVPANLYAGPSSYLAPQSSVGTLQPQSGQLNALPSPPANSYPPARLEEFEESNEGYPKVTPAIPFSF